MRRQIPSNSSQKLRSRPISFLNNLSNKVADKASQVSKVADRTSQFLERVADGASQLNEVVDIASQLLGKGPAKNQSQQSDKRLVKASLIPRTGEKASPINFMFNPTDLSLSRSVSIKHMEGARTEKGLPKVNFGFVEPYKLTLAGILFDTYETREDVLKKIQPLLDAVDFSKFKNSNSGGGSSNMRRPPVFYFIWGDKIYMCCMIKQLDYKLTMFLPNGTPVRAIVTIALEEVDLGAVSKAFSERQKPPTAQTNGSSTDRSKPDNSSTQKPTNSGKPSQPGVAQKPTNSNKQPTSPPTKSPPTKSTKPGQNKKRK